MVIVPNDYHVHCCQGLHLDSRFTQIGGSWIAYASLSFAFQVVAKLLCSNLCFFGAIVELHAKDEKLFKMGQLFALFVLTAAAAESAIGLVGLSH